MTDRSSINQSINQSTGCPGRARAPGRAVRLAGEARSPHRRLHEAQQRRRPLVGRRRRGSGTRRTTDHSEFLVRAACGVDSGEYRESARVRQPDLHDGSTLSFVIFPACSSTSSSSSSTGKYFTGGNARSRSAETDLGCLLSTYFVFCSLSSPHALSVYNFLTWNLFLLTLELKDSN